MTSQAEFAELRDRRVHHRWDLWGIPYKVDVKSVVWYPIKAFEAAGYEVPTTWDELIALSDQIVADGKAAPGASAFATVRPPAGSSPTGSRT